MTFTLSFSKEAAEILANLEGPQFSAKLRRVRKALGQLQLNPKYPALSSHKYESMKGLNGEEVWDSYVENNTPSAWRIFWHYGPGKDTITIVSIGPHP